MQDKISFVGCGMLIIIFIALSIFEGFCFEYSLWSIFGKDIPWYSDIVAGLCGGQLTIPVAAVCWVIRLCGVSIPFVR